MNDLPPSAYPPVEHSPFRSPLLMNTHDSAVIVIDVQEKLLPHIVDHHLVAWNISRLIQGAKILDVAVRVTEQYPQGLGHTIAPILNDLSAKSQGEIVTKTMFSIRECSEQLEKLSQAGIHNLLLCGIESHVCVAQSAFDLLSGGFNVFVCADAIGARSPLDHQTAIRRMESCGVSVTTTEAVLFEWCESSRDEHFKQISKIVQQPAPQSD